MENKSTSPEVFSRDAIAPEVKELLQQEVEKDIADEEDDEIREFLRDIVTDAKDSEYLFLKWFGNSFKPKKILYMGSGNDVVPKTALGEENVVHMSMEDYLSIETESGEKIRDKKYFPDLGSGDKVVGDITYTPFRDSSFQAVLLLDLTIDEITDLRQQAKRAVEKGGNIVLSRSFLNVESEEVQVSQFNNDSELERLEVPQELQEQGASESKFFIFRKK